MFYKVDLVTQKKTNSFIKLFELVTRSVMLFWVTQSCNPGIPDLG